MFFSIFGSGFLQRQAHLGAVEVQACGSSAIGAFVLRGGCEGGGASADVNGKNGDFSWKSCKTGAETWKSCKKWGFQLEKPWRSCKNCGFQLEIWLKLEIWGLHARILAWIHKKNVCPQRVAESMYGCPFREPRVFEIAHIYIYTPNLEWYLSEHFSHHGNPLIVDIRNHFSICHGHLGSLRQVGTKEAWSPGSSTGLGSDLVATSMMVS